MADLSGFIEKAKDYLNDVVHLRVITAVGEFNAERVPEKDSNGQPIKDARGNPLYSDKWTIEPTTGNNSAIMTDINLVQGDITNLIAKPLVTDSNTAIRDFHTTQVEKAEGIVRANIAALKGMIEVLVTAERENQPAPGQGPATVTPAANPNPAANPGSPGGGQQ